MSKYLNINSEIFMVNEDEYNINYIEEFCNLNILKNLGEHERIVSLLNQMSYLFNTQKSISFYNITHGGYIPIKCADFYHKIFIKNEGDEQNNKNIETNINYYNK